MLRVVLCLAGLVLSNGDGSPCGSRYKCTRRVCGTLNRDSVAPMRQCDGVEVTTVQLLPVPRRASNTHPAYSPTISLNCSLTFLVSTTTTASITTGEQQGQEQEQEQESLRLSGSRPGPPTSTEGGRGKQQQLARLAEDGDPRARIRGNGDDNIDNSHGADTDMALVPSEGFGIPAGIGHEASAR